MCCNQSSTVPAFHPCARSLLAQNVYSDHRTRAPHIDRQAHLGILGLLPSEIASQLPRDFAQLVGAGGPYGMAPRFQAAGEVHRKIPVKIGASFLGGVDSFALLKESGIFEANDLVDIDTGAA